LIAIGIALAYFGYASYRTVEHDLSDAALSGRTAISVLAASTLTQDFQRLIDIGRSLASRVRFGELIAAERWGEAAQVMVNVPRDFPAIEQVLLIDAAGRLQGATPAVDSASATALSEQLRALPAVSQPFVSNVQAAQGVRSACFLVVLPVLRADERLLGWLALRISARSFLQLFAQLQLEPDAAIQVLDRRGQLAFDSASPGQRRIVNLSNDPRVQRMFAGEVGVDIGAVTAEDVVAFAPTAFGWGVLTRWPQRTVFAARDAQLRRVLFTCALFALILSMAFGLLLLLAIERRQRRHERRTNLELESRVRERTAQLEKANVDLESFSYSVSHDLRAPLRAINGYVQFLFEEHQGILDASARRCIDHVQRNVCHMSRLIDELLELARVGRVALEQEIIDMGALVSEVLPTVLGTRSNVAVDMQVLPPVYADATLIRQIWVNLLDNAVKYSSHTTQPRITICAETAAGQVTYCVADNGAGFDMRHYEQLFKPFSRLHSSDEFSGTGVGLALVKRIVERYDGRVWAESIPNQGTKVFFSLPIAS
jgi:signal transduction histidine kinase